MIVYFDPTQSTSTAMNETPKLTRDAVGGSMMRLVRLAPNTLIETTALPAQFGNGPATDCWVVRDDGNDDVLIGYGHDDRCFVPRSSISLPNADVLAPAGEKTPTKPQDV
jgi:hypothetical protein